MMHNVIAAMFLLSVARAATGTLEVEVARPDGSGCTADVEARKVGGSTVIKKFAAVGGSGVAQLDAGDYDVKATCRVGGFAGAVKATVKGGSIVHYRIGAKATTPPPPDLGSGKMHTVTGTVQKVDGGHVRVISAGKEIGRASVKRGNFSLYDLKPGEYTLQLFDSANKKRVEKKITIKPQAVTISP